MATDNTVAVAIITAASGFGGALLGAAGAVVGPWILRRSERRAESAAARFDEQRRAIVAWADAAMDAESASGEHAEGARSRERKARLELVSFLPPGATDYINSMRHDLQEDRISSYIRRQYIGYAATVMLQALRQNRAPHAFLLHIDGPRSHVSPRRQWPTADEVVVNAKNLPRKS